MAKTAFNKKTNIFIAKLNSDLKKKPVKCYILSIAPCGTETLTLNQKYLEKCEMWRWRRVEVSWTDRVRYSEVLHRFKTKNKMGTLQPEGHITGPRNTRIGKKN